MKIPKLALSAFLLILFISVSISGTAQTVLEGGPMAGISWYNGDLNHQRQFYRIHPSFGAIVRYNVNDRIALRGGIAMAGISGAYPEKDIYLPENSDDPYTFKRNLVDISTLLEINFFSFDHPHNKNSIFTPYVALGIGTTFYKRYTIEVDNYSEKPTFVLSLPFGAGVKWKVNDRLKVGAEWTFRKTFADDLDFVGQESPVDPSDPYGFNRSSTVHNNDWYSIVGIYATFSLFTRSEKCNDGF